MHVQEVTNLVWAYAKIGSPLSEEACALMDMVPAEVLLQLSDDSRRCKVRRRSPKLPVLAALVDAGAGVSERLREDMLISHLHGFRRDLIHLMTFMFLFFSPHISAVLNCIVFAQTQI